LLEAAEELLERIAAVGDVAGHRTLVRDVLVMPLTLMLTTAGPFSVVMREKSGNAIGVFGVAAACAVATDGAAWAPRTLCTAVTPAPPMTPAVISASTRREDLRDICFMVTPGWGCCDGWNMRAGS
jgi:hypothetical protein